ncbi:MULTISPECIES: hypothetical protein [Klebsiella]|jgi:hypothetical protein|uniref:hypothetical protein n=1 Tax=Klebsiella TaxID=570 RepID=UPI000EFB9565|nr:MULTISPECIES: hypothetical protein [Klebsiella]AYO66767.1 hypothetical protein DA795_06895 [Klebsiella pneumoniae]MBV0673969.1 hypothetical protein [Klebsiella pneumoniae]MCJ6049869.1 hypothetical protein [Klebsiella pneumoniae]MCM5860311.1 hypothetical protein [Klebsiella pneumoniae]MDL4412188.1 hypothetical protein [Klebsiella variicola]
MNRILLMIVLMFLVGKVSADTTSPLMIQPKNGETLEDSKKHTMEYFGCIKGQAVKYAKTGESVDSISKASVVSCESYIPIIAESNIYYLNSSQEGKRQFTERLKSDGERLATKFAMDEKLKKN